MSAALMGLFDFFARRALYTALSGLWGRDYQGKPCFPWFVGRFGTYPKRFQVFCNFFSKKVGECPLLLPMHFLGVGERQDSPTTLLLA